MAKNITIKMLLDGKPFEATILSSDELVKKLNKSVGGVGKGIANWGMIVTGFNQGLQLAEKITGIMGSAIAKYGEQEQSIKKVEQAIKSTGGTAGYTATELQNIAGNLQEITAFDDDVILNNATAQILTFTKITGENFKRTQQAALDVATVLTSSPEEAATRLKDVSIQLGKALNNPVKGLSALGRAGIQFSESQTATIKNLAETNRLAEAQTLILDELNKQYGGQAEAVVQTVTGQLQQLQVQMDDQVQKMGKIAAETVLPIAESIMKVLIPSVDFLGNNIDTIIPVLKVASVATATWAVATYGAEAALKAQALATALAEKITALFNKTLKANPAFLVIGTLATLTAALYELTNGFKFSTLAMRNDIDEQEKSLTLKRESIDEQEKFIKSKIDEAKQTGESKEAIKKYNDQLIELNNTRKELAKTEAEINIMKLSADYIDSTTSFWDNIGAGLKDAVSGLTTGVSGVNGAMLNIQTKVDLATGSIKERVDKINGLIDKANDEQKVKLLKLKNALLMIDNMQSTVSGGNNDNGGGGDPAAFQKNKSDLLKKYADENAKTQAEELQKKQQLFMTDDQLEQSHLDFITQIKNLELSVKNASNQGELDSIQKKIEIAKNGQKIVEDEQKRRLDIQNSFNTEMQGYLDAGEKQLQDSIDAEGQFYADRDLTIQEYLDQEAQRNQEALDAAQLQIDSTQMLNDQLVSIEQQKNDVLQQMRDASTAAELKKLQDDMVVLDKKKKLIEDEKAQRQKQTEDMIAGYIMQYDAQQSFVGQLGNVVRQEIKMRIAEAVAVQIAKVIGTIPFPFNIIAAPAAAFAVSALFDAIIPKFENGGWVKGPAHKEGGKTINVEGDEFIVNKKAAKKNKELLEAINSGDVTKAKFLEIEIAMDNEKQREEMQKQLANNAYNYISNSDKSVTQPQYDKTYNNNMMRTFENAYQNTRPAVSGSIIVQGGDNGSDKIVSKLDSLEKTMTKIKAQVDFYDFDPKYQNFQSKQNRINSNE